MPIRHAIWKVGTRPEPLVEVSLGKEALLEQMITEDTTILSDRWLLIGRQVRIAHGIVETVSEVGFSATRTPSLVPKLTSGIILLSN